MRLASEKPGDENKVSMWDGAMVSRSNPFSSLYHQRRLLWQRWQGGCSPIPNLRLTFEINN